MHIYPAIIVCAENADEARQKGLDVLDLLVEDGVYDSTSDFSEDGDIISADNPKFMEEVNTRLQTEVAEIDNCLPYIHRLGEIKTGIEMLRDWDKMTEIKTKVGIGFGELCPSGTEIKPNVDLKFCLFKAHCVRELLEHITCRQKGFLHGSNDALIYDYRTEGNGNLPCNILEIRADKNVFMLFADCHF